MSELTKIMELSDVELRVSHNGYTEPTKDSTPWYARAYREAQARRTARELAKQIGDEEWRQGNTKYAFEAYEAACVPPSEILAKAEALLGAERTMREWRTEYASAKELQRSDICKKTKYTEQQLNYCLDEKCTHCMAKKQVNARYTDRLSSLLGWDKPELKSFTFDNGDEIIEDKAVSRFSSDKYRAAAVAALKLVSRLERVYVPVETEEAAS